MNTYVNISDQSTGDCIYDLLSGQKVEINNRISVVDKIQIGDKVTFSYGEKEITIPYVRYVNIREVIGRQTCVADCCVVLKWNDELQLGEISPISTLEIGDKIMTPKGYKSITHMLLTKNVNNCKMYRNINNLLITGYHPIFCNDQQKWIFPIDDKRNFDETICFSKYVYSLAIEDNESFLVNDTLVLCLNHQIENDEVASHPYFGSRKVLEDIESLSANKKCIILPEQIQRDKLTGLINRII
jgi:hypothetical protein